jgi:hypothetical protein
VDICDLIECVDSGLDFFGANIKEATYSALENNEGVSSCEMLSNPESLVVALKSVFGAGYILAERSIINEMKKKFDLRSPASYYTIDDAFRLASRKIRENSRRS